MKLWIARVACGVFWIPCASAQGGADAFARRTSGTRERMVSVVYEVRVGGGVDADRVELKKRPLRAGERYVVEGRLGRLTLEARPWEGERWLVRYAIVPKSGTRGMPAPGVFEIVPGERRELHVAARAHAGGAASRMGKEADAVPMARGAVDEMPSVHAILLDFDRPAVSGTRL